MNKIEEIREEINNYFDQNGLVKNSREEFVSSSKKFKLHTLRYKQLKDDVDWEVTNIEVYDNTSQEKIFNFFGNDGHFFHQWLIKDNTEYLICAEDLFGGQTVIDLTNKKMESYSPGEDGFIHAEFYLSPNEKLLAVVGCYWACSYEIKIYDFSNPLSLPLKELDSIVLPDSCGTLLGWYDNETLLTDQKEKLNLLDEKMKTKNFYK